MWAVLRIILGLAAVFTPAFLFADTRWPEQADAFSTPNFTYHLSTDERAEYTRPKRIPFPADSPFRHDIATLGKMLFFDPRLSANQNISCSTCHNPSFGWAAPVQPRAANHSDGARHAPTVVNAAWITPLFWDGRALTLEDQATAPIEDPQEMASDFDTIVRRLHKVRRYREWFNNTFPGEGISRRTIITALATFQRTIVSGIAPFDRWIEGDEQAISPAAKRGFALFQGKAHCSDCHNGWMFTDNSLHDVGLTGADLGQGGLPGQSSKNNFKFKTPGLRDITLRAPYMHDGSMPNLRSVIRHYANGGSIWVDRPTNIRPFYISEREVNDLIAFLHTLTATDTVADAPILPSN